MALWRPDWGGERERASEKGGENVVGLLEGTADLLRLLVIQLK